MLGINATEIIGIVAGTLTTIAFVPQVLAVIKSRSVEGISLPMYIIFCSGIGAWIVYGWLKQSPGILMANMVTFALAGTILILKLRWGRK